MNTPTTRPGCGRGTVDRRVRRERYIGVARLPYGHTQTTRAGRAARGGSRGTTRCVAGRSVQGECYVSIDSAVACTASCPLSAGRWWRRRRGRTSSSGWASSSGPAWTMSARTSSCRTRVRHAWPWQSVRTSKFAMRRPRHPRDVGAELRCRESSVLVRTRDRRGRAYACGEASASKGAVTGPIRGTVSVPVPSAAREIAPHLTAVSVGLARRGSCPYVWGSSLER